MKKQLIILALLFFAVSTSIAQEYQVYLDSAESCYEKQKYFEAYKNYKAAKLSRPEISL